MWTSTLQQYCSGPVDGKLYAIVRKTAAGDWIEESSAGEDSGCGASSNIGYRPEASPSIQQPQPPPPTPPARTSVPFATAAVRNVANNDHDETQDLDSLLEGLLGVGRTASTATPAIEEVNATQQKPQGTERERQLATELARTRRQIRRRMRRMLRPPAGEDFDFDEEPSADEQCEQHFRQQSFRSERAASPSWHRQPWHHDGSSHRHQEHRYQHQSFHQSHQRNQQHHQSQWNSTTRPWVAESAYSADCSNSPKSLYSTPEGDVQIQLGDAANQFGPDLFKQPPLWERHFRHPQLNSLPRSRQRPAPVAAAGVRQQQRLSERFDETVDLVRSRDILERRLEELQAQMNATRSRVQQQQPQSPLKTMLPRPRREDRMATATIQQRTLSEASPPRTYQEIETVTMQPIGRGIHNLGAYSGPNMRLAKSANEQQQPMAATMPRRLLMASVGDQSGTGSTTPRATTISPQRQQQPIRIDQRPSRDMMSDAQRTQDTMHLWYRPGISREETVNLLQVSPPGSFLIRDSTSFPGAFGLAVHADVHEVASATAGVSEAASVRHFLLEPAAGGVRLRGSLTEPAFAGLAAFVAQHAIDRLALPCRLRLPELPRPNDADAESDDRGDSHDGMYDNPDKIAAAAVAAASASASTASFSSHHSGVTAAFSVAYIGTASVESLTGSEAITRAVSALLGSSQAMQPVITASECQLRVGLDGVTLTDQQRRQFFRKHFPLATVLHCGLDGLDRRLDNRRVFGLIVRSASGDNACIVLCEDVSSPNRQLAATAAQIVVSFVNQALLGAANGRRR